MSGNQAVKKGPQFESRRVGLDAEALMSELRSEIERVANSGESRVAPFFPLKPKGKSPSPLSSSEDLLELNLAFPNVLRAPQFTSHRPVIGKFIVLAKKLTIGLIWKRLVIPSLQGEREFLSHLIKYLNFSSQAVDQKFGQVFWDLIRKIDIDVQGVNERVERVANELDGTIRTIERSLSVRIGEAEHRRAQAEGRIGALDARVHTVENVTRGLERTVSVQAKGSSKEASYSEKIDPEYLLLENRFRGLEENLRNSLEDYLPFLEKGPILDIGCGRGELLELLKERGVEAKGIDLDPAMVGRCLEKGLSVVQADLFQYLKAVPSKSLGGIIATQVVEHLSHTELREFIELARLALRSGGVIILETINPQSVTALSRNFFRDPTHVFPVHPETLRFTLEMFGYQTAEIHYRSHYPDEAKLQPVETSPELPARWIGVLQRFNDNVTRLNDLLFAPQDYAVIAIAP